MRRKAKLASCKDPRQVWKTRNLLTKKHKSKAQQTTSISHSTLNDHFSTTARKILLNDMSKENDLGYLKNYVN